MKRNIWFWLFFVLSILLAIYFSSRIIMTTMGYGYIAQVHRVSISTDTNNKDRASIAAAAGIAPGTHVYAIDLDNLNARVAAVPGVRHSAVRRRPDGNLTIRAELYQAVALWTDGDSFYPLSADGTIVNKPTDVRAPGTILFQGKLPNDIDKITRAAQNLAGDVDYLEWIENRRWNLHTTGGIKVMLPEHDPISAIGTLVVLNKNHQILSKDIRTLDMRDSARILVK
ncbi:MAG: cell division protein FtsQ/DivIB [Alphaproteobacteria bacterium]|nr:cell division protein FtsQ/DivIB [Alphaproteobacteria bacterium]